MKMTQKMAGFPRLFVIKNELELSTLSRALKADRDAHKNQPIRTEILNNLIKKLEEAYEIILN